NGTVTETITKTLSQTNTDGDVTVTDIIIETATITKSKLITKTDTRTLTQTETNGNVTLAESIIETVTEPDKQLTEHGGADLFELHEKWRHSQHMDS
ncbi:MAG: hypothetical protein LBV40_01090, partial [Methanomicrobiales archaeon]|nr:hypothetical protein [Methanomicrobiales archaeon]